MRYRRGIFCHQSEVTLRIKKLRKENQEMEHQKLDLGFRHWFWAGILGVGVNHCFEPVITLHEEVIQFDQSFWDGCLNHQLQGLAPTNHKWSFKML